LIFFPELRMPDLDADTDETRSRGTSSRAREAMVVDIRLHYFVFALFVLFVERSCYVCCSYDLLLFFMR